MSWAEKGWERRVSRSWVVKFDTHHTSTVLINLECIVDDSEEFPYGGFKFVYRDGAIVELGGERKRETGRREVWPTLTFKFDTHHTPTVLITLEYIVDDSEEFPYGGFEFVYRDEAIVELGGERLGEESFTKLGCQI